MEDVGTPLRIGALAVLAIAVLAFVWETRPAAYAREDLMLAMSPSAARAAAYGNRHLDALSESDYDLARAEALYRRADAIDATYPSVQHQLARIEFLHADFPEGLERINREIGMYGDKNPNAYYIRALILGYQGKYMEAAADYEKYFKLAPANWAGINDYAWVLLKANLPEGALAAVEWGLGEWPDNPWLLHNKVIALYELKRYEEAAVAATAATAAVETISREGWLIAYPGNDPLLADEGLASFKKAVYDNQKKVKEALEKK